MLTYKMSQSLKLSEDFILSIIGGDKTITILGLNIINNDLVPFFIPLIVWLFSMRYQYLSALSLNNYRKYNIIYEKWKERFENTKGGETLRGIDFKPDDMNEFPNMFRQLFVKANKSKIKGLKSGWVKLANVGSNFIYYLLNFDTFRWSFYCLTDGIYISLTIILFYTLLLQSKRSNYLYGIFLVLHFLSRPVSIAIMIPFIIYLVYPYRRIFRFKVVFTSLLIVYTIVFGAVYKGDSEIMRGRNELFFTRFVEGKIFNGFQDYNIMQLPVFYKFLFSH